MRYLWLAEDNPADVYLLRESLKACHPDVELEVFTDGEAAIQAIRDRAQDPGARMPDLIILDLNLPKSDGNEILRCVKQQQRLRDVPVLMLTSSDAPRDRALAEALGVDRYLRKPNDLDAFLGLGGQILNVAAFAGRSAASGGSTQV